MKRLLVFSSRKCSFSTLPGMKLGVIGLGSMGSKLVSIFRDEGKDILAFDINSASIDDLLRESKGSKGEVKAASIKEIALKCSHIISILPNDDVLNSVSDELIETASTSPSSCFVHISCSTVSPTTSRALEEKYASAGLTLVAAPVFARYEL